MELDWHPDALRDVEDILDYVRSQSVDGARNVSFSIERAAESCALVPFAGAKTNRANVYRSALRDHRITIFYRVHRRQNVVEILRVVRSGRIKNLRSIPRR